ncbi:unnamed protein product [Pylaiella littoralis]
MDPVEEVVLQQQQQQQRQRWKQGRRVGERHLGECTNAPFSTPARVPRATRKRKGGPRGDAPVRSRQKVCAVCSMGASTQTKPAAPARNFVRFIFVQRAATKPRAMHLLLKRMVCHGTGFRRPHVAFPTATACYYSRCRKDLCSSSLKVHLAWRDAPGKCERNRVPDKFDAFMLAVLGGSRGRQTAT